MNDLENDIARKLTREILILWRQLMASDYALNKKSDTTLEFSRLDTQAKVEENNFQFNLFYNDYLQYIEQGRKPFTTRIPIRPLIDWMKRNMISDDVSVAYAIRESIYKVGIEPRKLIEPFGEMIDERFESTLYDYIYEKIISRLDNFFNK